MVTKVNYNLACCMTNTNTPQTSVKVGQSFDLVLYVQDLRPRGIYFNPDYGKNMAKIRGVFAAYCDILYNKSLCQLGVITHSNTYPNGQSGYNGNSRIEELGGFAQSFSGLGTGVLEVARVAFKALAVGVQTFKPDFIQLEHPIHDTLVYGNISCDPPENSYVDISEISYLSTNLTITH